MANPALTLLAAPTACAPAEHEGLNPNVILADENACFDDVEVLENYIDIPRDCRFGRLGIEEDSILVSASDNPYLRSVISFETLEDVYRIHTRQASITEALSEEVEFSVVLELTDEESASLAKAIEFELTRTYPLTHSFNENINGANLEIVIADGSQIEFGGAIYIDGDLGLFSANSFESNLDFIAEIELDGYAQSSATIEHGDEVPLFSEAYKLPKTFKIGGIPVRATVEIQLLLGYEFEAEGAARVDLDYNYEAQLQTGLLYNSDSGWSSRECVDLAGRQVQNDNDDLLCFDHEQDVNVDFSPVAQINTAKIYIKPQIGVVFYDQATAAFALESYVNAGGTVTPDDYSYRVRIGQSADLSSDLTVLDHTLLEGGFEVFEWNRLVDGYDHFNVGYDYDTAFFEITTSAAYYPPFSIVNDTNQDGVDDIAVIHDSGLVYLIASVEDGDYFYTDASTILTLPDNQRTLNFLPIQSADFNNDQKNDLLVVYSGNLNIFYGPFEDSLDLSEPDAFLANSNINSIESLGDFNGDTNNDIYAGTENSGRIYYGPFSGNLQREDFSDIVSEYPSSTYTVRFINTQRANDLNGDGLNDIIVNYMLDSNNEFNYTINSTVFYGSYDGSYYLNSGDAQFSGTSLVYNNNTQPTASVGDVNGDGYNDISSIDWIYLESQDELIDEVYIFHGPIDSELTVDTADGVIFDETGLNGFSQVADAGDINDDDHNEIAIVNVSGMLGRYGWGDGEINQTHLFLGPIEGQVSSDEADFIYDNAEGEEFMFYFIDAGGDVNGDGVNDMLLGSWQSAYLFSLGDL